MQILEYSVEEKFHGMRLDIFLTAMLDKMSRSAIGKLFEAAAVQLDGKPCKKNRRVTCGEQYTVILPELQELGVEAENIPLDVVYEDEAILIINKPKGMVVHPAPGNPNGTLVNALLFHYKNELSGIGGVIRPGIVHRIDKDTSGLLIVAKNDEAHLHLSRQLKDHSMYRIYEALIIGSLHPETGTIQAPIGRSTQDRKKMAVTEQHSRPAVTHYQTLERFAGYSHIQCRLETGRTHQIRVHMAYVGHPILGDEIYGGKRSGFDTQGQCLHAKTLCFIHPVSGERMEFTSNLPEYFDKILTKLRK